MRDELKEIRRIRIKNNDLWLEILDIALREAPEVTKRVLAAIRKNDADIVELTEDIINED